MHELLAQAIIDDRHRTAKAARRTRALRRGRVRRTYIRDLLAVLRRIAEMAARPATHAPTSYAAFPRPGDAVVDVDDARSCSDGPAESASHVLCDIRLACGPA